MKEKGRFLKQYRGDKCLNCNIPLDTIDRYCHNCGQVNTTKKLSFRDFFYEFFGSIFSYDSRLWHTITALLFKPGKISRDYIDGKRITYANPFRFYLSVSIFFFIINGFFWDFNSTVNSSINFDTKKTEKEVQQTIDSLDSNLFQNNVIKHITKDAFSDKNDTTSLKKKGEITYYSQEQLDTISFFKRIINPESMYSDYYNKNPNKSVNEALIALEHSPNWENKYIYKRAIKIDKLLNHNDGLGLVEFIFEKLPIIIFFFLPFFALGIWLLYIRTSFTYMEHLVFVFHTITMYFILIGLGILLNKIFAPNVFSKIATFIFLFYLYKAMRKFYKQKRFKTIVKFLLVNVLFFILATIGSLITLIGSIFLF